MVYPASTRTVDSYQGMIEDLERLAGARREMDALVRKSSAAIGDSWAAVDRVTLQLRCQFSQNGATNPDR